MKKQLLVVDDDINLLNFISSYLKLEGFLVDTASTVKSALPLVKANKPDMILADIMMPYLDGYSLLQIIRSDLSFASIPVIFITAKGLTRDRIHAYNLGCNAYITKPFNPEELVSIINNIFTNMDKILVNSNTNLNATYSLSNKLDASKFNHKEKAILILLVQGFMNKEIAKRLDLSVRNVEKYVSRLLNKTKTRNRTELAKFALLHNLCVLKGE